MCNIFSAIFVFLLASSVNTFAADIDVIVYADNNFPPYSYEEGGAVKGIYSEILKTAFSRMDGYKVNIKAVPWKRGLNYLERGEGFALYPPYHHTKERPYMWPYSLPILDEKVVVFCTKEILENPRPRWPEDYYGLTIGNNSGFEIGGDKFWRAVREGKIKVREARGNVENLRNLFRKRIDCHMNDRLSILWELKRLKESGKFHGAPKLIEGATISIEQGFLGYTDRDNHKFLYKADFVKKLDAVIYEMRRSGELKRIIDEYLK